MIFPPASFLDTHLIRRSSLFRLWYKSPWRLTETAHNGPATGFWRFNKTRHGLPFISTTYLVGHLLGGTSYYLLEDHTSHLIRAQPTGSTFENVPPFDLDSGTHLDYFMTRPAVWTCTVN